MASNEGGSPTNRRTSLTDGKGVNGQKSTPASTADPSLHRNSSSLSTKDSHSHTKFGSLFGRDHHEKRESVLTSMLAPAMQVAGAHNPFSIHALCEDGKPKKTHSYGSGKNDKLTTSSSSVGGHERTESIEPDWLDTERSPADDDEATVAELVNKRRSRKRDRFRSAFGRSLSPWHYHNVTEKARGASFNLSKRSRDSLDVQREKAGQKQEDADAESDAESIRSGIVPRNSAFGNFSEDSDSEDEMGPSYDSHRRSAKAPTEELVAAADAKDETIRAEPKDDKQILESTSTEQDGKEDDGEESDDYIDFDDETLDNTLYNAGCIDLHDAWKKDDYAPSNPSAEDSHSHSHAHYGPDDYDAAWRGAGPSGHDENDEGLRAPNVVIGQSHNLSPSELTGEGIDILSISDSTSVKGSPIASRRSMSRDRGQREAADMERLASKDSLTSHSNSTSKKVTDAGTSTHSKTSAEASQKLSASRPVFEKNRCTITLVHGEYERFIKESKRPRRYIVASDGSEESAYAIEWTIGTVLRDGDEMLVVSVMETDSKLDASDPKHEDKQARLEHQRIRQSMAVILARRAVSVLQRTRLGVRVSCQALHARNSRHMFIDMIDFFEPTMCVVGSRGLGSLKGVLLGSFSHYCVQKSPVPVMVVRKRLKLPPLPKGKTDVVSNVRARHMRLDQAVIEKEPNVSDAAEAAKEGEAGEEAEKDESHTEEANDTASKGEDKHTPVGEQDAVANSNGAVVDAQADTQTSKDERQLEAEKEEREKGEIKRDAKQAAELQEKEKQKQALAAKKQKSKSEDDGKGHKIFHIGSGTSALHADQQDDGHGRQQNDEAPARGRSRSRQASSEKETV